MKRQKVFSVCIMQGTGKSKTVKVAAKSVDHLWESAIPVLLQKASEDEEGSPLRFVEKVRVISLWEEDASIWVLEDEDE